MSQDFMTLTDMMEQEVIFHFPPKRIISLVPSQTELLFDLGLDKEVVGITKFCVHPKGWLKSKEKIGGTKNFNFKKIGALNPDLIIGNKEENYIEGIEELKKDFPVLMTDIHSLKEAFQSLQLIGNATGRAASAKELCSQIEAKFNLFVNKNIGEPVKVLYLIWQNPFMGVGEHTFVNEMLQMVGLKNVLKGKMRYPELSYQEIVELNSDLIFLSSEPYPFKEKHLKDFSRLFPRSEVVLVDGEMFSWYGSRLLKAPEYFRHLLLNIQN